MRVAIHDGRALEAVSPGSLAAYARAAGWTKVDEYGKYSDVYAATGLPELVIPRTHRLDDYAQVVSQLLGIFASTADTDELSLYRDLVSSDRDVVRVRALPGDSDGSITVQQGADLLRGAYDMLSATACSVAEAQPVYYGSHSRQARDFLGDVRLGQTEQSSYVVTLLMPTISPSLQRDLDLDDLDEDEPIGRRLTKRLVQALEETRRAVERVVADDPHAFGDSVRHGVSANLCDALARLAGPFPELDVIVSWARTRPVDTARSVVRFGAVDASILQEAARVFRISAPRPDVCLTGPVARLSREEQESDGAIAFRAYVNSKVRSVKAVLRQSDYLRAVQAHGKKHPIVVRGDLERVGRGWRLLDPRLVEVISSKEPTPSPEPS